MIRVLRVYIVAILSRHFCGRAGKTEEYKAGQGPALLETSAEWGCLFLFWVFSILYLSIPFLLFLLPLSEALFSKRI